jgi:hypothetical protein
MISFQNSLPRGSGSGIIADCMLDYYDRNKNMSLLSTEYLQRHGLDV